MAFGAASTSATSSAGATGFGAGSAVGFFRGAGASGFDAGLEAFGAVGVGAVAGTGSPSQAGTLPHRERHRLLRAARVPGPATMWTA